jgi:secondary thiamine-phosphate synthase enzyme
VLEGEKMTTYHECFEIETESRPSFHDVSVKVKNAIKNSGIKNGIAVVYSQHTTCSVMIQEDSIDTTYNGTKYVFQDLLDILDEIVPECKKEGQYMHPGPKCVENSKTMFDEDAAFTLNTDAHLRSSLIGRSESIPVVEGVLQLGEHGHIFFADFDGTRARTRTVQVQLVGE